MNTYLSCGIGDFVALDSLLTVEEKQKITSIYWACRFGSKIKNWIDTNDHYPNVVNHYFIEDNIGKQHMASLDPNAIEFWHFRPDFSRNFKTGLHLFGNPSIDYVIDVANIFNSNRGYTKSSFIDFWKKYPVIDITTNSYILVHYPTSTRPRSDIATITSEDWELIYKSSKAAKKQVIVITDVDLKLTFDFTVLKNPDIKYIPWLVANCYYYFGCDSFVANLASKLKLSNELSIKSHNPNVKSYIHSSWGSKYFLPHLPSIVETFYKPYLEYKL